MEKKRKILSGYTLIEMLLVMAMVVVLGAFGVGGFLGTRETMTAKENVELIKQDIKTIRLKSMLLEQGTEDNWLYGIGIDLQSLSAKSLNGGEYTFFKWCSPFEDFGDERTRSLLPGWDPNSDIGTPIGSIINNSPIIEIPSDPAIKQPVINYEIRNFFRLMNPINPSSVIAADSDVLPSDPIGIDYAYVLKNGYLSLNETTSCQNGVTSKVDIRGSDIGGVIDIDSDQIKILGNVRYLMFEALTGRAFLYNNDGSPANYTGRAVYNGNTLLDIVMTRKRSSKIDVISVYPLSGTVIHHVYGSDDIAHSCLNPNSCITIDGIAYKRYGIADEINSYRDGE